MQAQMARSEPKAKPLTNGTTVLLTTNELGRRISWDQIPINAGRPIEIRRSAVIKVQVAIPDLHSVDAGRLARRRCHGRLAETLELTQFDIRPEYSAQSLGQHQHH